MKIHDSTSQHPCMNTSQKMPAESFQAWMNPTGHHSGQSWYWQHQHHLQPSALEFISIDKKDMSNIVKNRQETSSSFSKIANPETVHTTNQIMTISAGKNMQEKYQALMPERSSDVIDNIKNNPYEIFQSTGEATRIGSRRKIAKNIQKMQLKTCTDTLKKQRIYQKGNQVECTVNWAAASEKSHQKQIRLLKKWFGKLGIQIRKFIINGVIQ